MLLDGKYSGEYFPYDGCKLGPHDAGKVHAECHEAWQCKWAPKCLHCGGAILLLDGKHSGKYHTYQALGGSVHEECNVAFMGARERPSECKPTTADADLLMDARPVVATVPRS